MFGGITKRRCGLVGVASLLAREATGVDSVMKGLFGGGDEEEAKQEAAKAEDFEKRYQEGDPAEGYSPEEAVEYYKKVAANATPEQLQQATKQAVEKLTPEQRADFAKMLEQRQAGQVAPQTSAPAAAGVSAGGMGVDDILGSLMGSLGGATAQPGATSATPTGSLTDILGSMLGGTGQPAASAQTGATAQAGATPDAGGFDLGALLSSPAAKAVLAGVAAFGMKEILGNRK